MHASQIQEQKKHYEDLLSKAKSEKKLAEERAQTALNEGLQKKFKESESRCQSLQETVEELREALERQRATSELREDMLQSTIDELEKQVKMANTRCEEMATQMTESNRPLVRQIEAMQTSAATQQDTWLMKKKKKKKLL
eukprot:TRINITY_DN8026_c1_g1_i3.p4 TRINITY_DN8026_c1_g1~~TRINITY_DN8026_c1_g1_i3.p4  ORF type:complete len:140 (+),score=34.75 TRINITY_DN8026_c1_g1_i3:413-832(+)